MARDRAYGRAHGRFSRVSIGRWSCGCSSGWPAYVFGCGSELTILGGTRICCNLAWCRRCATCMFHFSYLLCLIFSSLVRSLTRPPRAPLRSCQGRVLLHPIISFSSCVLSASGANSCQQYSYDNADHWDGVRNFLLHNT